MSEGGDIAIDMAGGVATLRLRNPARRNAVSSAMWRAIRTFAADVSANKDVRVVVIRGDGDKAFSAGADIADFETARSGAANARAYDDLVEDTCQLIEAIARPTLAVIIGPCMGAGASLAASCDLRIAADNAFFAVPAARLGLGYDPRGIKRFLRVFGASATCELIFTAGRLPAQRAHQLGTVSALVCRWRRSSASPRNGPAGSPRTPRSRSRPPRRPFARTFPRTTRSLAEAEQLYAAADASADYAEGRRAFTEKRTPRFTGN